MNGHDFKIPGPVPKEPGKDSMKNLHFAFDSILYRFFDNIKVPMSVAAWI